MQTVQTPGLPPANPFGESFNETQKFVRAPGSQTPGAITGQPIGGVEQTQAFRVSQTVVPPAATSPGVTQPQFPAVNPDEAPIVGTAESIPAIVGQAVPAQQVGRTPTAQQFGAINPLEPGQPGPTPDSGAGPARHIRLEPK